MDGSVDVGAWNPCGDEIGSWNFYGENLSKFLHGLGFDRFDTCSVTFFFFVFFLLQFSIEQGLFQVFF